MKEAAAMTGAVRLAVANMEVWGLPAEKVLKESIVWLNMQYTVSGDRRFLQKALYHIRVYMEMGFYSDESQRLFDEIADSLQLIKEEAPMPQENYNPGIMDGYTGIGYYLLRMCDDRVLNILGLEVGHTIRGQESTVQVKM